MTEPDPVVLDPVLDPVLDAVPDLASDPVLVARRVGPVPARADVGERSTNLAADNHFAGALLTLWHAVSLADGAVGFTPGATRAEIAPAVTEAVNGLRSGKRFAVVLTRGAGELVAVAFLLPGAVAIQRHLGEVRSFMVAPDLQGRGVGRRLMDEIIALAGDVAVDTLLLGARDGHGLDRFYTALGFVEYGRIPDAVRLPDGTSRDELLFLKALSSG